MRVAGRAGLLLAVIAFLSGCSGFWEAPSGSSSNGGCGSNCTTASSGAFYILSGTPQISGGAIVSGKLSAISGSPWPLASVPYSMAISPNGTFLYVSSSLGVMVYPITNGVLGAGTQVSQDDAALGIRIDTTGSWLIEAVQVPGSTGITMAAVPLNVSSGGAVLGASEVTTTYNVNNAAVKSRLALSPDNKNLFVPLGSGGALVVPFNASAGAGQSPFGSASLIPVANSGGSVLSAAVDPQGRLFYLGEVAGSPDGSSGGVLAYNYSSLGGTLKQAAGSPMASGGTAPNAILAAPAGDFIYVANGKGTSTAGSINSFSISASGSGYSIASGSSVAAGVQPLSLAEDSSHQFLFALGGVSSPYLRAYTFDAATPGKLDAQIVASSAGSPLVVVAAH